MLRSCSTATALTPFFLELPLRQPGRIKNRAIQANIVIYILQPKICRKKTMKTGVNRVVHGARISEGIQLSCDIEIITITLHMFYFFFATMYLFACFRKTKTDIIAKLLSTV